MHKPSEEVVQSDDKDDEEDVEKDDEEKIDDEKVENIKGDDAKDEEDKEDIGGDLPEIQSIEDSNAEKIVVEVMASLPNSLRKSLVCHLAQRRLLPS